MIIRIEKCSSFGIKKAVTSSVQHLPKLILNHDLIPTVEIGKSIKCFGRYFNFSMNNHNHLSEILDLVTTLMAQIDHIPCHPKTNCCYIIALSFPKYHGILP